MGCLPSGAVPTTKSQERSVSKRLGCSSAGHHSVASDWLRNSSRMSSLEELRIPEGAYGRKLSRYSSASTASGSSSAQEPSSFNTDPPLLYMKESATTTVSS